jgi:hypothetical protein
MNTPQAMVYSVDSSSDGNSAVTPLLSDSEGPQTPLTPPKEGRKMKVITVATHKSGYYYALEESAERLGYDLVLLGLGEKWRGFGWRTRLVINYLKTLPDDELFLAVDAYDVILLRNSAAAVEGFKKVGARFLCGGFRKLEGLPGVLQEQEFGASTSQKVLPGPYNSICAGTWMSTAKVAVDLWDNPKYLGSLPDNGDDQRLLNRMFDDLGVGAITPDTSFELFMTLFPDMLTHKFRDVDKLQVSDHGTLISGVTNTEPILLHALCNADIQGLLKTLKFKHTKDLTPPEYIRKKTWYHVKTMIKHSWAAKIVIATGTLLLLFVVLLLIPTSRRALMPYY